MPKALEYRTGLLMTGEVGGVIYEGYWRFCDLQTFVGLKDVGLEVWGLKEGLQNTSTKPDTDCTSASYKPKPTP